MEDKDTGFNLEMPSVGIIKGVLAKDIEVVGRQVVNLRTCARPYKNLYSVTQLRAIKNVLDKYGSGKVHMSPRHNLETPEVKQKDVDNALKELYIAGLFPGGAGTSVRNIFTCPDWCSKSIRPVQEIGKMVSINFGDKDMPNKVTVSFAGCSNSCSRPQNTDIGVIAVRKEDILAEKTINEEKYKMEETGFKVIIGGKEGSTVMFGHEYAQFVLDFEVLEIIERALSNYQKKVQLRPDSEKKMERLGEVVQRLGLETFME